MSGPRVSALTVYPLKSGRGVPHRSAQVDRWGLRGDRRWMVVTADGAMVSARKDPRLLLVSARPYAGGLRLGAADAPDLDVPLPEGSAHVTSDVWGGLARGLDAGDEAAAWVQQVVGRAGLRLLWCDDPRFRPVDQTYAGPDDTVSFQDGFPLLLTSTASLARVQEWVDETAAEQDEQPVGLTMRRFRPNVVVDGLDEPLVEQRWTRVRLGGTVFRMAKHCGRCVMTTYDPETLERSREPLRSLARHNTVDGRIVFGVNLVPEAPGTLQVGDPVTVL